MLYGVSPQPKGQPTARAIEELLIYSRFCREIQWELLIEVFPLSNTYHSTPNFIWHDLDIAAIHNFYSSIYRGFYTCVYCLCRWWALKVECISIRALKSEGLHSSSGFSIHQLCDAEWWTLPPASPSSILKHGYLITPCLLQRLITTIAGDNVGKRPRIYQTPATLLSTWKAYSPFILMTTVSEVLKYYYYTTIPNL